MENQIITLSVSQVTIASLIITSLILIYIIIAKKYASQINFSSDFSGNNYLLGIVISMVMTILCMNVTVSDTPHIYTMSQIEPELTPITPITVWKDPRIIPPPPKPKKEIEPTILIEEAKITPVKKIDVVVCDFTDPSDMTETVDVDTMMQKAKAVIPEYMPIEEEDEIVSFPEEMPRFPGCEDMVASKEEKIVCAEKALLEFIYLNVKYPRMALESGITGSVIVRFVVDKNGNVEDAKIVRDIGAGCGKAALKAVELMNEMPRKWTPGKQRGKPVKVQFTLPIKFDLM